MCAPGSDEEMIFQNMGNFDKYASDAKDRRYMEEFHKDSLYQKQRDGRVKLDKNQHSAASQWAAARDEAAWSALDDAKYLQSTGKPGTNIDNPPQQLPQAKKKDFKYTSKNNLEAASDYKSKKQGEGSKKSSGVRSLRINKQKPKLNTPANNPQSGLNIP